MDPADIEPGLRAFLRDAAGSTAELANLRVSDGHAGLTFLFDLVEGATRRGYVIKLPPRGVKRRGNTDVYRQAPLLRALHGAGLPVPAVPWAYDDNPWFDLPFIVMERLPGYTFFVWDPAPGVSRDPTHGAQVWDDCIRTLAALHAFDWRQHLAGWEAPQDLAHEITRWERIYAQAPEPEWIVAAEAAERALLDSLPDGTPVGLFHGDYQPGNCLYMDGRLSGVIDWELSGIGAQMLDLGWLAMCCDPRNWTPGWTPLHAPSVARLAAVYAEASGRDVSALPWYQALAGYRLASISCLNVKLHRKGQRHDPIWEHNGRSVLPMFNLACQLVAGG